MRYIYLAPVSYALLSHLIGWKSVVHWVGVSSLIFVVIVIWCFAKNIMIWVNHDNARLGGVYMYIYLLPISSTKITDLMGVCKTYMECAWIVLPHQNTLSAMIVISPQGCDMSEGNPVYTAT